MDSDTLDRSLMNACPLCSNPQVPYPRVSLKDLRSFAVQGCKACRLRVLAIDTCIPIDIRFETGFLWLTPSRWRTITWQGDPVIPRTHVDFELLASRIDINPVPGLPPAVIRASTASEESLLQAKDWLEKCSRYHDNCRGLGYQKKLPKRILYLTGSRIRLIETSESTKYAKYACLSHCWGGFRPACITTRSTLATNTADAGIPLALIPKSFRHAIHFTLRLGLSYLWIDSLCIVQDDVDDWKDQASKMASIYQNAHITLCATFATNSTDGLYFNCNLPTKLTLEDPDGDQSAYFVPLNPDDHLPEWDLATATINREKFPLMTRAWAYQERLLSRRLLHFAKGELMWECSELSTCECDCAAEVKGVQSKFVAQESKKIFTDSLQSLRLAGPGTAEAARHWHDIVEVFTSLELSFSSDMLPALSGVAQQIGALRPGWGEYYLAGLWRTTLMEDLRWKVSHSAGQRPEHWRAPSWSWASVSGAVYFADCDDGDRRHDQIIEASTTPDGPDLMGGVTSGSLVLSAVSVEGRIDLLKNQGQSKQQQYFFEAAGFRTPLQLDCRSDIEDGLLVAGQKLMCVRVGTGLYGKDFCLVLQECVGNSPSFVRVGWLECSGSVMDERWFQGMPMTDIIIF